MSTGTVGDTIEQTLRRIQAHAEEIKANPEIQRQAAEERDALDRQVRARQIASFRANWNAPKRHLLNSDKLQLDGEWGNKLRTLKSKLGTGMLVALVGGRGPGKTQLGVELMREVTSRCKSAYFLTATDFFIRIKHTYRKDDLESEKDILREFRAYTLLVIDEVGKRAETDWENNLLFELINGRYNNLSDTLLVDNSEPEEFARRIGPSLASRISETGGIVHCTWPSFRE